LEEAAALEMVMVQVPKPVDPVEAVGKVSPLQERLVPVAKVSLEETLLVQHQPQ
jgi:hypothetical protein